MHTSTNNHPKIRNQLIIGVVILTIVNIINCLTLRIEFFPLIENQILYIYSSLAQIVGALLGLSSATIFLCLIVLAVYKGNFTKLSPFFMTETMLIFVFAIIEVIKFVP